MEWGTTAKTEHGSGAVWVTSNPHRVRPLQRQSVSALGETVSCEGAVKQGGNTESSVLVPLAQGRFVLSKEGIFWDPL